MARQTIKILRDPDDITLISDPERVEILRILNSHSMTCTQLANRLNLTKAAVGYHVSLLLESGLIRVDRSEVESHGIMQRYYTTTATRFIADPSRIPEQIRRRFLRGKMNRLRGILALPMILQPDDQRPDLSLEFLEELAEDLLQELYRVGKKYEKSSIEASSESIDVFLFAESFGNLLQDPRWSARLTPIFRAVSSLGALKVNPKLVQPSSGKSKP